MGTNTTDILLAASDRPYGANQFYGPYDSWERTKGWFGAVQQRLGEHNSASFAYRRHTDLFVLLLDDPAAELDVHNLGKFFSIVAKTPAQLIITSIDQYLKHFPQADKLFHVKQGKVIAVL